MNVQYIELNIELTDAEKFAVAKAALKAETRERFIAFSEAINPENPEYPLREMLLALAVKIEKMEEFYPPEKTSLKVQEIRLKAFEHDSRHIEVIMWINPNGFSEVWIIFANHPPLGNSAIATVFLASGTTPKKTTDNAIHILMNLAYLKEKLQVKRL